MTKQHPTIDDIRESHKALLHLVEIGAAFAFPGHVTGDPVFRAAVHCSADDLEGAIPLGELAAILHMRERRYLARYN